MVLIFFAMLMTYHSYGQSRLQALIDGSAIRTNVGMLIPLTKLKTGAITDPLIEYENRSIYWQAVNVNVFFNHVGINLTLQISPHIDEEDGDRQVAEALRQRFGEDYFITSNALPPLVRSINANIHPYLGVAFTKRWKRWALIPKFQLGFTSFNINPASYSLKQKDSNRLLEVAYLYNTKRGPQANFSLMMGCITEFSLTEKLLLDFNVQYFVFKSRFFYTESIRDTFTEEIEAQEFDYRNWIHMLSIGIGVGYKF
ncbi:MAG: hypothetical protein AAGH46_12860 [Bacteroidota bacterium]